MWSGTKVFQGHGASALQSPNRGRARASSNVAGLDTKPEPTKECAARLRFDLKYDSSLEWETYARLMVLGEQLFSTLSEQPGIDTSYLSYVRERYFPFEQWRVN